MKRIILFILAIFCMACLRANVNLVVWQKDGTTQTYQFKERPRIKYVGTQLVVASAKKTVSLPLSSVGKFTLSNADGSACQLVTVHSAYGENGKYTQIPASEIDSIVYSSETNLPTIYDYLKNDGHYSQVVNLIDDLGLKSSFRTEKYTILVADDKAFAEFFKNNKWGVSSYSDLSESQKKTLLHAAMVDGVYQLEMLPSKKTTASETGNLYQSIKTQTMLTSVDLVEHLGYEDDRIPNTICWERFKNADKKGIYLAEDVSVPMLPIWMSQTLSAKKLTSDDDEVIFNNQLKDGTILIGNSKVLTKNICCKNGYVSVVDKVILPQNSMSAAIAECGKTKVFSTILDMFSAPYYNADLTAAYKESGVEVDSVFEKRYFSSWAHGELPTSAGKTNYYAPGDTNQTTTMDYLAYDPAWNLYYPSLSDATYGRLRDGASMFVPSDEALLNYFTKGGGKYLAERYFTEQPVTSSNLSANVTKIPTPVLQEIVNNLMKASFVESVPSKYLSIKNTEGENMFANCKNIGEYKNLIDTTMIASNGVVYVVNKVYTPATYASVAAPALVNDTTQIMNWGTTYDDKYLDNPDAALMGTYMSVFLKAMNSTYTLFIPSDNAFKTYYDPVSWLYATPYALDFEFDGQNVTASAFTFDSTTYQYSSSLPKAIGNEIVYDRMTNIMNSHVIVHDNEAEPNCITPGREWYITREGAPIKITDCADNKKTFKVQGGWQINRGEYINVTTAYDQTRETNGYGNGMTYIIDGVIQGSENSVYKVLSDNEDENSRFRNFYELCNVDMEVLKDAGMAEEGLNTSDRNRILSRYLVFTSDSRTCADSLVRFFNNYNYTVFVPTNEAIDQAIEKGLPTWKSIAAYIQSQKDTITLYVDSLKDSTFDENSFTANYKLKAQAMITCLLNFVNNHFATNSVFADNIALEEQTLSTFGAYEKGGKLTVQAKGNHEMTITDISGNTYSIVSGGKDGYDYNVLARDLDCNSNYSSVSSAATSKSSATKMVSASYAVIHRINGYLDFDESHKGLSDYRFDTAWKTTGTAKKFVEKFMVKQ